MNTKIPGFSVALSTHHFMAQHYSTNLKKTLLWLTLAVALSAYSQGTVAFITRNPPAGVNAVCTYTNTGTLSGGVLGPIANGTMPATNVLSTADGYAWGGLYARAGLYGATNGSTRDQLVLLAPSVGFRTGALAGYVDPGYNIERTVPGVPGGAQAVFQVRSWDTGTAGVDSYEAALAISLQRPIYLGESPLVPNIWLPGEYDPTLPAMLVGLQSWSMDYVGIPEPTVIGLGILCSVTGLLVFHRCR